MARCFGFIAPFVLVVACSSSEDSSGGSTKDGSTGGTSTGGTSGDGGTSTGGTSGSSGGSGGRTTDASADAPSDPCATALFCEDFEAQALGSPPSGAWEASTNDNGTVVVSDEKAQSGTHAAKFTTDGASSYQRAYITLQDAPVFPLATNEYYGRMLVWLVSPPDDGVHWTMIQSGGPVAGETFTSVYRYGGQHHDANGGSRLMANYDTGGGTSSDCWQHSATAMPTGKWACVEWHFDGTQDHMEFWLDGAELSDLGVNGEGEGCIADGTGGKWFAPTFENIQLGFESYQNDPARELWIDDVVIDDARVGCP